MMVDQQLLMTNDDGMMLNDWLVMIDDWFVMADGWLLMAEYANGSSIGCCHPNTMTFPHMSPW